MKKKELLARIEALERRVEELEARTPQWSYTVPIIRQGDRGETVTVSPYNGTRWPNKDTCTCGITSIEPCPVHPIRYSLGA